MQLLIDTQALLWWLDADERFSVSARRAIASPEHVRFFSVAGAWELTIKCSTGKLRLNQPAGKFLSEHLPLNRTEMLGITLSDLVRLESLPRHHRDPFDRLIAAQAIERRLTIVSSDPIFDEYGIDRAW